MKKLLLIDGNSVLFRAYYSTAFGNRMSTSSGLPTNAVYGFIMMVTKALNLIQPDCVLVAWDAGKPTFRHEKYHEYKGTRKPLDEELIAQMPVVREFLDEAGLTRYEQEGYEADDIIGSMAKSAPEMETTILTSDKDLLQLIDPTTRVLLMKKGITEMAVMDEAALKEQYGLNPAQIIDLKGLMGDSSDNIPGVKGVGEKTALKLLSQFGSVEGVYEHIDEVKGKMKEKLEAGYDQALLSKELATIYTSMDLPFGMENLLYDEADESVNDFYRKYEMNSLIKKRAVNVKKKLTEMNPVQNLPQLTDSPVILLPCQSLGSFQEAKLYGFITGTADQLYYITKEDALADPGFKDLLARDNLIAWDAKSAMHALDLNGFEVCSFDEDLHLTAFLLYSQATSEDTLIEALKIETPFSYKDLAKKSLGGDSPERTAEFNHALASGLLAVRDSLFDQLKSEDLYDLYADVEFPLAFILYQMEKEGIRIDLTRMDELRKEFGERLNRLREHIYELAGREFNVDSPKQLGMVLFDELNLPSGKKRSTAVDVLEGLREYHPIIDEILEYRKFSKLMTTYIDGLQKHIEDGRIHTTFNQTMTQTGRLSSSDPNLQNISVKNEDGRKIREIFVADEGCILLSADYSQIELRVLADMADERIMIDTFLKGVDIHIKTACEIFSVKPDEVTPEQRRVAKTVNFGIIYGQTDFGLAQELHISRAEAKEFMNTYFASYPNIHRYMNEAIEFCKENGYAKTLLKRRRYIPEINDKNYMTREFGKRAAMNAPIQGTAADLIKLAMIKVSKAIKEKGLKSRMLLQIHDELIFNVPMDEKDTMLALVPEVMASAMSMKVPLETSVNTGRDWAEAK